MPWPLNNKVEDKAVDVAVAVAGHVPAAAVGYVVTHIISVIVSVLVLIVSAFVGIFLLGNAWDTTLVFSVVFAFVSYCAVWQFAFHIPPIRWLIEKLVPDASSRALERIAGRDPPSD
jgi:hypothetical protein